MYIGEDSPEILGRASVAHGDTVDQRVAPAVRQSHGTVCSSVRGHLEDHIRHTHPGRNHELRGSGPGICECLHEAVIYNRGIGLFRDIRLSGIHQIHHLTRADGSLDGLGQVVLHFILGANILILEIN